MRNGHYVSIKWSFNNSFLDQRGMFGKTAFPSSFLSPAQSTGISTLYRNSYGAPAEDIKHNQVSKETKMSLF